MALSTRVSALASAVGSYLRASVLPRVLPAGGTVGDVLSKISGADYAAGWVSANPGSVAPTERLLNLGEVSGAVTLDLADARTFSIALTGDLSLTISNAPEAAGDACALRLYLRTEGYAVLWPTLFEWPSGIAPKLSFNGGNLIDAVRVQGVFVAHLAGKDYLLTLPSYRLFRMQTIERLSTGYFQLDYMALALSSGGANVVTAGSQFSASSTLAGYGTEKMLVNDGQPWSTTGGGGEETPWTQIDAGSPVQAAEIRIGAAGFSGARAPAKFKIMACPGAIWDTSLAVELGRWQVTAAQWGAEVQTLDLVTGATY